MTKFPNREDPGYDAVLGELQRWKEAAASINSRNCDSQQTRLGATADQGSNNFGNTIGPNARLYQGNFYGGVFS